MSKLRLIVMICFFAAFGAGLTAGRLWERQVLAGANAPGGTVVTPPVVENTNQIPVVPKVDSTVVTPSIAVNPNPIPNPNPSFGPPPGQPFGTGADWLAELKLSKDQKDKMRQIWSEVMHNSWALRHERHDAVHNEKDEAILALFTSDQRVAYDVILKQTESKYAQLETESRALQETAVAKTREILTPEQRVKYDELRKKREQEHHFGGGGRPDGRGDQRPDRKPGPRPGSPDNKPEHQPQ